MLPCRLVLAALLFATACHKASDSPDTGRPDAGPFSVSGTVELFPLAASWLDSHQLPAPSFEALQLTLDDPFVRTRGMDGGVSEPSTLGVDGTFSFGAVDLFVVSGVSARLVDPRPALDRADAGDIDANVSGGRVVITSETMLFEGKPETIASAVAWALPLEVARAASQAAGIDLEARGVLLGQLLDPQGNPIAGATVVGDGLDPARLFYLGPNLEVLPRATATGQAGAFAVLGPLDLTDFSVTDRPELGVHKALCVEGQAVLLVIRSP